jgi:hypothetical protein
MDLLSTVLHELGNAMGFAEDQGQDVSGATLQAGVRRIPTVAASPAFTVDPSITLPAGFNSPAQNSRFVDDPRFIQASLNAPNGVGVSTPANTGSAQISTPANPAVGSGLPIGALVSGTTLSFAAPTSGSFVTLGSALTTDLGGNLSGPSAIPAYVPASEPSPVDHSSKLLNTSEARPDAGEATVIDWGSEGLGTLNQLGSSEEPQDWLNDFVNHLGQNQTQRNPNAGISVRPTAAGAHAQI